MRKTTTPNIEGMDLNALERVAALNPIPAFATSTLKRDPILAAHRMVNRPSLRQVHRSKIVRLGDLRV
jgi:hypothetical protein